MIGVVSRIGVEDMLPVVNCVVQSVRIWGEILLCRKFGTLGVNQLVVLHSKTLDLRTEIFDLTVQDANCCDLFEVLRLQFRGELNR